MRFSDLAWGAFVYSRTNRGSYGESDYTNLVGEPALLARLQSIPELEDFEKIRMFISHFGIHQIPKSFAEHTLVRLWPTLRPHVAKLAKEDIVTINLNDTDKLESIRALFEWPYWAWGLDTTKSKVIHFFNIKLFVMWDGPISQPYPNGGEGYIEFLRQMQIEVQEAIADYQKLDNPMPIEEYLSWQLGYQTKRPLTKFLDQFNWITTTKDWPKSIPDWLLGL